MNKISVVITAFNEEKHLEGCLKSVKDFADEIVVVDTNSTDATVEIAKRYGAKIFHHKNEGFVEPTRNFAIGRATNEWVLILDADERITPQLAKVLTDHTSMPATDVVMLPRKNLIFNKWIRHAGWWPDYQTRFFKKGAVVWRNEIHSQPDVNGSIMSLDTEERLAIVHENYQTISQFLTKSQRYSYVRAKEIQKKGDTFAPSSLLLHPFREFLSRYFAREGYKDGLHGFVLSVLTAIDTFFIDLQLWEMGGFKQDESFQKTFLLSVAELGKEFSYWIHGMTLSAEKNQFKKFIIRVKRKLSL